MPNLEIIVIFGTLDTFWTIKSRNFLCLVQKPVNLKTRNWYLVKRLNTFIMRLLEHGLVQHFESVSKRTFKQAATELRAQEADSNLMVAKAGGLHQILIACCIYLIGISLGIVVFIVELCRPPGY